MNTEVAWQRAVLLCQQQRWDLAERELRGLLGIDPAHAPAHALLGDVLVQAGRLDEALVAARESVAVDPAYDGGYHAMAVVQMSRNRLDEAVEAIGCAIRCDPDDCDHFGLLAHIRYLQQRWPDALAAADQGLERDPEDTDCLNLRSLSLTKLGRSDEANESLEASLARDPDNPYTHQAQGYAKLHQGQAEQALRHFQEALRRDPSLDGARAGMVEAIKSRSPIYRWVLAPFVWMERFPENRRTQILVGAWLVAQLGRSSLEAAGHEGAARVVGFSWLTVVLVTACIVPFFNLLLLLHPLGRHALDRSSRLHALLLGAAILVDASMFVIAATTDALWARGSRWIWLVFLLPVAGLGLFHGGWGRRVMQFICLGLLATWLWWLWWLWRTIDLDLELAGMLGKPATEENLARARELKESIGRRGRVMSSMIWTAALSTWFVLLAPKGHLSQRRR